MPVTRRGFIACLLTLPVLRELAEARRARLLTQWARNEQFLAGAQWLPLPLDVCWACGGPSDGGLACDRCHAKDTGVVWNDHETHLQVAREFEAARLRELSDRCRVGGALL